jgi:hypothetical protein
MAAQGLRFGRVGRGPGTGQNFSFSVSRALTRAAVDAGVVKLEN